jgi:hypothetical protein
MYNTLSEYKTSSLENKTQLGCLNGLISDTKSIEILSEEFWFRPGQFHILTGLIPSAPIQVNCTVLCIAL